MDFGITCDINWESKVNEVLGLIPHKEFRDFFYLKNYGADINRIIIGLMCHELEMNLKQRIRFVKKEKIFSMDIMLDFDQFIKISQPERNKIVFDKLIKEVPETIAKYKFKDFDLVGFTHDFTTLINNIEY